MESSSSSNLQSQDSSSFHVGETSSTNVKIGSPADEGGENQSEAGSLNPGISSDHSVDMNGIFIPLLTPENRSVLYLAALAGDWERARILFDDDQAQARSRFPLTARNETALHIAAAAEQTNFVENLANVMTTEDLALPTEYGYTALCFAAILGNLRMGKLLVERNPDLPNLHAINSFACLPLYLAVTNKRRDMADYLFPRTELGNFKISDRVDLLHAAILSDYYDIGLKILREDEDLAVERNNVGETALHALARKPYTIGSRSQLTIWDFTNPILLLARSIQMSANYIYFKKTFAHHQMVESLWKTVIGRITEEQQMLDFVNTPTNFLYDAARVGNAGFLVLLIRIYPNLISNLDYNFINVFYEAVENRQESVFKLMYEIGVLKNMMADMGGMMRNTVLMYLAAQIAAPKHLKRISNPALQMTRELLWFKEMKRIVKPSSVEDDALWESFRKEHKQLREEGEEWMKRVSSSCLLVAALIAGAIFAATFNLPKDNNNNDNNTGFRTSKDTDFVFADVLALFSSTVSILTFLSILTSRFAEEDFLFLPWSLFMGFASLFLSITCMLTALCTIFIKLDGKYNKWISLLVNTMLYIFSVCYGSLNSRLWIDTLRATLLSEFPLERRRGRLMQL